MELHPLVKVVIGVLGLGVVTVAIWLGLFGGDLLEPGSADGGPAVSKQPDVPDNKGPLPISPTGPYPKVVVEETTYRFPTMRVGTEGQHVFTIQNKGEAPLRLNLGDTTCRCTISNVDDGEIPPGGEAHVKLTWKAINVNSEFRQEAEIWTNDPDLDLLELVIIGSIALPIEVRPTGDWMLSQVIGDKPITISGHVVSAVHDSFDLESPIQTSSKTLTAEATPLTPQECQQLSIKCGYRIEATLLMPQMPIGPFREHLTIAVDLPNVAPGDITISGTRTGPISILATGRTRWNSNAMIVGLGEFDAALGAKAALLMFVAGLDETKFQFLSVEKNLETIQVTLQPDPKFQSETRQIFLLTFEVPPGGPTLTRGNDRPVRITIKTNHPHAGELKFRVQFISR